MRCELNEILGDISPYQNMDEDYEYNTRDNEDDYQEDDVSSEDSCYDESNEYY